MLIERSRKSATVMVVGKREADGSIGKLRDLQIDEIPIRSVHRAQVAPGVGAALSAAVHVQAAYRDGSESLALYHLRHGG